MLSRYLKPYSFLPLFLFSVRTAEACSCGPKRFSIKILQGTNGSLFGWMYSYIGKFENCPKLDRLVKQAGLGHARDKIVSSRDSSNDESLRSGAKISISFLQEAKTLY